MLKSVTIEMLCYASYHLIQQVYLTLMQSPNTTFTINWKMSEVFFDMECVTRDYKMGMIRS